MQALDRPPSEDVGLHDLVNVLQRDVAVPDGVGINHDGGAVFALVEASRLVGADGGAGSGLGQADLEGSVKVAGGGTIATAARMIVGTLVAADEDVPDELWHENLCVAKVNSGTKKGRAKRPAIVPAGGLKC